MHLYSAGSNSHGQLSHQNQLDAHQFQLCHFLPALPVDSKLTVHQLALGANHTLALCSYASDSKTGLLSMGLWGCGSNSRERGQLGPAGPCDLGAGAGAGAGPSNDEMMTSFVRIPLEGLLANVSEEERQTHRIQVQDPQDQDQDSGYDIVSIACAWETSFVHIRPRRSRNKHENVASSDLILSFGANAWNERATPNLNHVELSPVNIISFENESTSDFSTITSLVSAPRHVLAIAHDSSVGTSKVFGWGASRHGQVGRAAGSISSQGVSSKPSRTLERPCEVHLFDLSDAPRIGSTLYPVDLAVGRDHSIVLVQDSADKTRQSIFLFGSNKQNQLQLTHTPKVEQGSTWVQLDKQVNRVCATWTSSFFLHQDGTIQSFGSNTKGQLGRSDSSSDEAATVASSFVHFPAPKGTAKAVQISSLATGSEHVLAIDSTTGDVYGWGWNEHGNLGLSHTEDVKVPELVWSAKERGKVERIWCGNATSFILVGGNDADSERG